MLEQTHKVGRKMLYRIRGHQAWESARQRHTGQG
jgi:hypothetical protein